MEKNIIKERIIQSLETIGVYIAPEELIDSDDINLQEYISDSMVFIAAIVQLEQDFSVEIGEEYLNFESISSLNALTEYLYCLINEGA